MKYINKLIISQAEIESSNGEYTRNTASITPFANVNGNTITLSHRGWIIFDVDANANTYIVDHAFANVKVWSEENTNTFSLSGETIAPEVSTSAIVKAFWA